MTETRQKKKTGLDLISLLLVMLIVAAAVVGINCSIDQNEKTYEEVALSRELKEARDEHDRLVIEYQRRSSYLNVERYATEKLNMKKLGKSQYEYIDRDSVNTVLMTGEDVEQGGMAEDIAKAFSVILEYFR